MSADLRDAVKVDYSLLMQGVPPIAGPGSEVLALGPSWCGYCGYTGRVLGPRQASCPERHGWHCWLEWNAELEIPMQTTVAATGEKESRT